MTKFVAWLDALPVPLFLWAVVFFAALVTGVVLFLAVYIKGRNFGAISGAEMKKMGALRALVRVMSWTMSFPALLGAFLLYVSLTPLVLEKFFGLTRDSARLVIFYVPLVLYFAWATAHRQR